MNGDELGHFQRRLQKPTRKKVDIVRRPPAPTVALFSQTFKGSKPCSGSMTSRSQTAGRCAPSLVHLDLPYDHQMVEIFQARSTNRNSWHSIAAARSGAGGRTRPRHCGIGRHL